MSNEKPKSEQRGMNVHLASYLTERPIPTHTSHAWRHRNFLLCLQSLPFYLVIRIKKNPNLFHDPSPQTILTWASSFLIMAPLYSLL